MNYIILSGGPEAWPVNTFRRFIDQNDTYHTYLRGDNNFAEYVEEGVGN